MTPLKKTFFKGKDPERSHYYGKRELNERNCGNYY